MKTLRIWQTAHIIVDYQNDFVKPWASMYVPWAETIQKNLVEIINKFGENGVENIYTMDRHPAWHMWFAGTDDLPIYSQKDGETLWPYHCMAYSKWAQIYGKIWDLAQNASKIYKWTNREDLGYSWFENTWLDKLLKSKDIKNLFVSWVATDYCVKATVMDALSLEYNVFVIWDCVKEFRPENVQWTFDEISANWWDIIHNSDIIIKDNNIYISK